MLSGRSILRTVPAFLAVLLLLFAGIPEPVAAVEKPRIRISVENYPGHVQTEAVRHFAAELKARLGDRYAIEFYHSGQLFRDRDVLAALSAGNAEIAVPGTWQIDPYERSVAAFLLPACFAQSPEVIHALSDGPLGAEISRRMEESLNVVVLGRWLDLGHAHLFFSGRRVSSHQEIEDLRIRVAGGLGNELRIRTLGALPVSIPWNDLPFYVQQKRLDGVLTTYETARSGRLWEYGIRYAFEDHQYFAQYVPLMRRTFWNRLSSEDRRTIREVWESMVDTQRQAAISAQAEARLVLERNGIEVVEPKAEELEATRLRLLREQDRIAHALGIPPSVLRLLVGSR
ncbi:MAG: TRAP transporter substrate-binding protein DctP [Spirochaetaceae bacterium]